MLKFGYFFVFVLFFYKNPFCVNYMSIKLLIINKMRKIYIGMNNWIFLI